MKKEKQDEKITAGSNRSFWNESLDAIKYTKLDKNLELDVVIVGGGLAGISVAYCLAKSGKSVAIVEDGYIGSGESGRTTAHLVTALDNRYYELERIYGEETARLIAESHRSAIDFIESVTEKEKISCQFKRMSGYLFLHPSDEAGSLGKELEAASRAGLKVDRQNSIPGIQKISGGSIRFNDQAQFHPLLYLKGLADAVAKNGGQIFTETHAKNIDHTGIVTDEGFKISAQHVVVATNSPVNNKYAVHLKQFPYRTYVIGMAVKKNAMPEALWWDTGDMNINENIPPYHYIRTQPFNDMFDLLIIGGEDHATGLADADVIPEENRYAILESWAQKYLPHGQVLYKWSGQVMEPMDGLAYIGRNPYDKNNVFIVTGDSGNGMTHSTIAGMLISDLINEKENKWESIYSPSRFKILKSGKTLFAEFTDGLRNYFKTYPDHAEAEKVNSIKPGEGQIIELNNKKYGAYCDEDETIHLVNAECTHMGCIVKWNNDEKSWDCPCHGSRFTYEGKVLNGPANVNLDYVKEHSPVMHK